MTEIYWENVSFEINQNWPQQMQIDYNLFIYLQLIMILINKFDIHFNSFLVALKNYSIENIRIYKNIKLLRSTLERYGLYRLFVLN